MNWYIAKLVFAINHQGLNTSTQFDEQLRLVEANDTLQALLKSRMIGIKEENTYASEKEMEVTWQFVDVIELRAINTFEDGMEIHSRIDEHEFTEQYITYVKHRGQLLINEIERRSMQVAV